MPKEFFDLSAISDEEILEKMKAHSSFQLVKGGDEALRELVPTMRDLCEHRSWTIDTAVNEVGSLITASIIGSGLAQSARTVNGSPSSDLNTYTK